MRSATPLVEICVDDVAGAMLAEAEGADRIELCSALREGGITPSLGLVQAVLSRIGRIGLRVMVRPRSGDFVMSSDELEVMLADVAAFRALPRSPAIDFGFVFGALTPAGDIDVAALRRLLAACAGHSGTFHKAFDAARDLPATLETLAALGIGHVLTSGGAATAAAGAVMLARLQKQARGRIAVIAAGAVRAGNVAALLDATGIGEVHLRAMRPDATGRPVTVREEIAAVVRAARGPA